MPVEAVERHLDADSPLIQEVCVLPADPAGRLGDCTLVVVPNPDVLQAQKTPLALKRMWEVVEVAAATSPHPLQITKLVVVEGPLPRTPEGVVARAEVAEFARVWPAGAAHDAPADHPQAVRLLERLEAILDAPGPYTPAQHFEVDLGLDSLDWVQIRLLLSEEFSVAIPDDELWRFQTVADVVQLVVAAPSNPTDPAPEVDYSWAARLREPAAVPLDERFTMDRARRWIRHLTASFGMFCIYVVSRFMFRLEIVNEERLPKEGPFLLCPTHQSLLDSPLLYAAFPGWLIHRTVFVAYGPYFHAAPQSWLVRMGRLILTGAADNIADSMRLSWEGLQRGWAVVIFPEGNCSYDGSIMPAFPGVGLLACDAQVPIVPVLYQGSRNTCSPQRPGVRRTKIRVVVGEPLQPLSGENGRADWQAMADQWREAAIALQAEWPL
ncbi:MAG: 1-acyl-sn-glycerol-3-phosphate acyltransferase [Planctomycetes bacterium]|nr:1-acyl-sn-glycerol-3-phosphate acyltransferase [Planctomycetota bacterium]